MSKVNYRMGQPEDAKAIAVLFDMANAGLASQTWEQEAQAGETWMDVAERAILEPQSELGYATTLVAEMDGNVIGMLICTQQPSELPFFDLSAIAENQRPFIVLRQKMPGAFLLRDMAVFPEYRGQRIATQLLDLAIGAAYFMNFETVFAIVHETNTKLLAHYDKRGMKVIDSYEAGSHPAYAPDSKWLLLTCHKPHGILKDAYREAISNGE
jgi:ribosomal protein S18 acetylase RimI-like enzyme